MHLKYLVKRPTLFVVEGLDGTGKSTLAKHIAKTTHSAFLHMGGHKSLHEGMHEYHSSTLDSCQTMLSHGMSVVLDRHWPSEYVYGQTLRKEMSDRHYGMHQMIAKISELQPVYIFCIRRTVEPSIQWDQLNHDHPFDVKQFTVMHHEYLSLYKTMHDDWQNGKSSPVCLYDRDLDGANVEQYVKLILYENCQ